MDLLLWRHAEAVDADPSVEDRARELTKKGRKQARKMADWLNQQLPQSTRVFSSPAKRCQDTVVTLDRKFRLSPELSMEGSATGALATVGWPKAGGTVLLVGHQPMLADIVAQCLAMPAHACNVRKGSLWWIRYADKQAPDGALLVTVQLPEML
jgi:phosphohistidine phosphatase